MRAVILLAALVLAGCASADSQAARFAATCRAYGFTPGTDPFGACMMKQADEHPTFGQAMVRAGRALAADGGGELPGPEGFSPAPTATRLGGPSFGMCMKTGERFATGYKVCTYNCGGGAAVLNVGVGELCPISPN